MFYLTLCKVCFTLCIVRFTFLEGEKAKTGEKPMNKALKCAWFNLVITLVLVSLHAAAFTLIFKMGYIPETLNAIGFFVIFGLIGVGSIIFKRQQQISAVGIDERDNYISKRVLAIDYGFVWAILLAACVAGWFLMGPEGNVKIYALCFLLYVTFLLAMLVHSGATIIMYGGAPFRVIRS